MAGKNSKKSEVETEKNSIVPDAVDQLHDEQEPPVLSPQSVDAPVTDDEVEPETGVEAEEPKVTAGTTLCEARQAAGISEKDIADKLYITMHYVKAIESDAYEKLPGTVFAKGYIRSYALLVELEPNALIQLFDDFNADQESHAQEIIRLKNKRRKDKNLPVIVISVIGFILGFIGLWLYNTYVQNPEDVQDSANNVIPAVAQVVEPSPQPDAVVQSGVSEESALQLGETAVLDSNAVDEITNSSNVDEADLASGSGVEVADYLLALAADSNNPVVPGSDIAPEPTLETADGVQEAIEQEQVGQLAPEQLAAGPRRQEDEESFPQIVVSSDNSVITVAGTGSDLLSIEFQGESWVEVDDADANKLYRDIRVPGDRLNISGQAPFNILLGNGRVAVVSINGAPVDFSNRVRVDNSVRIVAGDE